MYGHVAAKYGTKLGAIEKFDHRYPGGQGANLVATIACGVAGFDQKGGASGPDLGTHLLEPTDRLAGASRQADFVKTPAQKLRLDHVGQIGRSAYLSPRRPGEQPFRNGRIYHIPAGAQPDSPTGQRLGQIGNHIPLGPDDEPQQLGLGPNGTRYDTAPFRPGLVGFAVAGVIGGTEHAQSPAFSPRPRTNERAPP